MNKLLQLTAEFRQIMRGWCEICLLRKARIFMVVVEDRLVAKAHICAKCFAAIQEETTGEIRSVFARGVYEDQGVGLQPSGFELAVSDD